MLEIQVWGLSGILPLKETPLGTVVPIKNARANFVIVIQSQYAQHNVNECKLSVDGAQRLVYTKLSIAAQSGVQTSIIGFYPHRQFGVNVAVRWLDPVQQVFCERIVTIEQQHKH
jgi:hypothetical protein